MLTGVRKRNVVRWVPARHLGGMRHQSLNKISQGFFFLIKGFRFSLTPDNYSV